MANNTNSNKPTTTTTTPNNSGGGGQKPAQPAPEPMRLPAGKPVQTNVHPTNVKTGRRTK
jgi:hypothetical protein